MKKIYQAPTLMVVTLQVRSHLMDLSPAGMTTSIKDGQTDGNAFVKDGNSTISDVNVWDNEW